MAYNKELTIGGILLALIAAGAKIYRAIERDQDDRDPPKLPTVMDNRHEEIQRKLDQQMAWSRQFHEERQARNEAIMQDMHDRHDAIFGPRNTTPTYSTPTYTPPTPAPPVGDLPFQPASIGSRSFEDSTRPPIEGLDPAPTQTQATTAEPQGPAPLAITLSPKPEDNQLTSYTRWASDGSYAQWLGEAFDVGKWRIKPSTEFKLDDQHANGAGWDVVGGTRGVGLDADLYTLYPRDVGLASPVVEDTDSRQVFRLGRRTIRTTGDAEVSYKDVNGLLVWRIHVPPSERSNLATCYYTAVVNDQAIVLTARYDAAKPEQVTGFDAIADTLQFTGP